MKGRWKSYRNVRFPFICSQEWNCYFQNRIVMFCLPVPTLIYLWEIYIFPGSVCQFCCREICGPLLGIYKALTDTFICSQEWNCYLQNRIVMFCLPVPTLYLGEIYIFPGSVCQFCCREICGPLLGIYKALTDTWMWKLGLRPRNSQKRNT